MSFLTNIALKKRWITFLVAALITVTSIWATVSLKTELIPDIELPVASVVTVYPGATPEQVAEQVTAPVERAIVDAGSLKEITSTSARNVSFVLAQYDFGTKMDEVTNRLSQNLSSVSLPAGARPPELMPISLDVFPIVFAS